MLDGDVLCCYNNASYQVEVNGLSVSFTIAPGYRDLRHIVRCREQRLFEFKAVGVLDVRVIDEPGIHAVKLVLTEKPWLRLQLSLGFEVIHGMAVVPSRSLQQTPPA